MQDKDETLGREAAERARSFAERGKQRLTEEASGLSDALRHASEGLRADDQAELARYTSLVATKLEELTGTLRNRDLGTMVSDVKRFAKRQPALFLGGAFTTGLIAARFLKSSSADRKSSVNAHTAFDQPFASASGQAGGVGAGMTDERLEREVTSPDGFGPAPGGYGPASAPAGAQGGAGTFGAEGAGGGPGNDPTNPDREKEDSG